MGAMAETPDKLTVQEAAQRFGVSPSTIRNWVARGIIRRYRKPVDARIYVSSGEIEAIRNAAPQPETPEPKD